MLSQLNGSGHSIQLAQSRQDAEHPAMHRAAPTAKNSPPLTVVSRLRHDTFPGISVGKETAYKALDHLQYRSSIPGPEEPLEEGTATHSRVLAWRVPRTEEPGRLQSTGSRGLDTTE